jgi:3-hydroxyisobutyrate dehydrogenase-like beta-hydroxyacid dehydrogenase
VNAVGSVGLGPLGLAIAKRLLAPTRPVIGFRRSGTAELEAAGGIGARSAADVARRAPVVITCLPDEHALLDVVAAMLPELTAAHTIVDITTTDPGTKRTAAAQVAERGAAFIDAPLSGQPADVAEGRASLFVGGEPAAVERQRPLLEELGRVSVVGGVGDGALMKFVSTISLALQLMTTAEVLEAGRAFGFAPQTVLDAVGPSVAGFPLFMRRGALIAAAENAPRTGSQQTFAHNLAAIARHAETTDARLTMFDLVRACFAHGLSGPLGDRDVAVVIHSALQTWKR